MIDAVSGVLLLAVSAGLGGGLIRDLLLAGLRLLSVLRGWSAPVAIDLPLRARARWAGTRRRSP